MFSGKTKDLEKQITDLLLRLQALELKLENSQQLDLEVESLRRQVENFELDYHNLYEKVRTNLAKLAKRDQAADAAQDNGPDLSRFRQLLAERKLRRHS